jgi:hypothetical protein
MTHEWLMDRKWRLATRTIGRLFDATSGLEEFVAYTGEDQVRPVGEAKVPHETAIPAGRYRVVLDFSNRFQKIMPHILDVPGFEGIRIHGSRGALPVEVSTEGCVCVGMEHDSENVYTCPPAQAKVVALLEQAEKAREEVWVTVA